MRLHRIVAPCLLFVVAGCAGYTAVDAQKPVNVGDGVTVSPQIEWGQARVTGFDGTLWTVDGPGLDLVYFFTGVQPGKPLIAVNGKTDKQRVYDKTMLPDDVMELLVTNFKDLGYQQITTSDLKPAPFGSATGFRFDLDFATPSGLLMKGEAIGAQRGDKLDLILYAAPAEYYYGHYKETVDKIMTSVTLAKS